jgi:hypothetical protein
MVLWRPLGQVQAFGDLLVGQAVGHGAGELRPVRHPFGPPVHARARAGLGRPHDAHLAVGPCARRRGWPSSSAAPRRLDQGLASASW